MSKRNKTQKLDLSVNGTLELMEKEALLVALTPGHDIHHYEYYGSTDEAKEAANTDPKFTNFRLYKLVAEGRRPESVVWDTVEEDKMFPNLPKPRSKSSTPRASTRWSDSEIQTLLDLYANDLPIDVIAARLMRTPKACSVRLTLLRKEGIIE